MSRGVQRAQVSEYRDLWHLATCATRPVIVLTAYPEGTPADVARQLGVVHIFEESKYQFSELLACIHKLREGPGAGSAAG